MSFKSQEKLPEIYANLDAQFLFSEREGLPLSLLEAQAVGVPYVGNCIGGIGEVVKDHYNGLLFNTFDPSRIGDKLDLLKEESYSFRKNARKVVENNYSLLGMLKKLENLYLSNLKV